VVIIAIGGTAGVGKTALAIHFAHQVTERFPNGQLYVNLRGFDPSGTPMTPAEAVRGFLDALGVPSERIPTSWDAQVGLYRSLLAGKRMLIVLDNACDERQVRPLLPASLTCLVLVTSRNQLTGLAATEGASSLALDLLTTDDAYELLARRLGADRVTAEPRAVAELIRLCARLPLALSIIAARAPTRPSLPLAALAGELRDTRGHARLDVLDTGEAASSVRAVLSWSYRHLSAPAARLFRLLGLHPGPDLTAAAAASLAAIPLDRAQRLLRELARAHLLAEPEHIPGRYAFHDLLRSYAAEKARSCDAADERHAALTRLFDHYLHAAVVADTVLPAERPGRSHVPEPLSSVTVPSLDTPAAARGWLDAERASLVAVTGHTARHGWPGHTTRLAAALFRYLERGGYYDDALTVHTHALHAARQTGDHAAQARALMRLAGVDWRQGRYQQATGRLQQALDLCRKVRDPDGEAMALANLGLVEWRQGRHQEAVDHLRRALAIFHDLGDRDGEARVLDYLGLIDQGLSRHRQAIDCHRRALAIFCELGDLAGQAEARNGLGKVLCAAGRHEEACGQHRDALALAGRIGDRYQQARAHDGLARAYQAAGEADRADRHRRRVLMLYTELGVPRPSGRDGSAAPSWRHDRGG
jgi:tetratricopeptide (TPR) repeat protein